MKIFVDENIPLMTVRFLREAYHEVLDIRNTAKEGIPDNLLWEMVQQEERLLITTDKGFAQYRSKQHHGVLIVCLKQPNRHKIHQRIINVISQFKPEEWPGLLVIIRDRIKSIYKSK